MEETIYISNLRNDTDIISDYVSMLKNSPKCSFSSIQKRDHILQIKFQGRACIGSEIIQEHGLTCVVENDLFRTVYINGVRVMWESKHN